VTKQETHIPLVPIFPHKTCFLAVFGFFGGSEGGCSAATRNVEAGEGRYKNSVFQMRNGWAWLVSAMAMKNVDRKSISYWQPHALLEAAG